MVKRILFLLTFLVLSGTLNIFSQNIPYRPVPQRLVNDFAGMLDPREVSSLEMKLVAFNDSTSTQIAIVTVSSLEGYDIADYAQRLGEKWGVGQKGKNNGILILVKPKTASSSGEVQIVTGYGVEGPIPDLTCSDIINREILPAFSNGDYYGGLDKATNVLMSLARGEFPASEYSGKSVKKGGKMPLGFILFIVFIIILISGRSGGNNRHISSKGLPFWLLMSMMGSGRGSGGSWGGFSGGSGGGGGGGFGGFGGGSFGGGGAGGSW